MRADKLIYRPGEAGIVHIRVTNAGPSEATGKLVTVLYRELADTQVLAEQTIRVPAKGEKEVEVPFTAAGRWGTCAHVTVVVGDERHSAEDYFSVTDNFFEVGIGYGTIPGTANSKCLNAPEKARANFANWMELLFWAPCDWSLLIAPEKRWWSGQASYPEDEDNLKELLARCHAAGIKAAMYASGNAAGPFGWELARRKPAWFGAGSPAGIYDVAVLDQWNDESWREAKKKQPGKTPWYTVSVDLRRGDALDWGIDQIIQSAKHYGWDAVRYDGHYTIPGNDELSTRNMRRLKERVAAALPQFRFGFNYGRAPEWIGGITHEMREAMAGGGLYMQEGVSNWRYTNDRYTSWQHYATNELRVAKQIQALGGSYHCIWNLQGLPPAQAQYKLVYGLIAGGHPCYDLNASMPPGCPNWGAFMTRWSAMLWDPALQVVARRKERFLVEGNGVSWEPFAQERVQAPQRKFVIQHLVNPPASDEIAKTAMPSSLETINAYYRPENGTKVNRAFLVRPEASPAQAEPAEKPTAKGKTAGVLNFNSFQTELAARPTDRGLCVTVPKVQTWAMVIWEVEGAFSLPPVPPKFTEPPDPVKMAQASGAAISRADPNKDDAVEKTEPGVAVVLLTSGGVNIGRVTVTDMESPQRLVQARPKDKLSGKLGKLWLGPEGHPSGPFAPGKYRVSIRLKWVDSQKTAAPQQLILNVLREKKGAAPLIPRPVVFVTPDYPSPPEGALVLGARGTYQFYELGTVTIQQPEYFTLDGTASTTKIGDHTLMAEKIKIEQLERFSDRQVEESQPCPPKPADLPQPNGAKPKKALFVKGMFWKQYLPVADKAIEASYQLPASYQELYGFDAVVLCNIDPSTLRLAARKMLKEFVQDGGRLVMLGGCHTNARGGIVKTYLDDMLPVTFDTPYQVVLSTSPLLLGPERNKRYEENPAVFGILSVTPREKSTTLTWAGDRAIAVEGKYGSGKVFVFAGTVLGEGDAKTKPFWETTMWSKLLRKMVLDD